MSGHIERSEKRRGTTLLGAIRLSDGTEIPCIVKDISPHGARLGIPQSRPLPEAFSFKIKGRDFVCSVRLVWRKGTYAGVRIERISKLADPNREARTQS